MTLTVRAYGENSCNTDFDEKNIEVSFTPSPIVKYIIDGQDVSVIEVCEETDDNVSLSGTITTNVDSITWTTSNGTGSFNSTTIENPIYTPSEADFNLGEIE